MSDIEKVTKIANFYKVPMAKLKDVKGYSTTLQKILAQGTKQDPETEALICMFIDYTVLFVETSKKDRNVSNVLLKELDSFLSSRSYLVGQSLTLADLSVFFSINDIMQKLSHQEREQFINVSRWFNHIQLNKAASQGSPHVNFTTIHLVCSK